VDGNFEALRRRIRSAQEKDSSYVTEISQELLGGWQFRSAQEKDSKHSGEGFEPCDGDFTGAPWWMAVSEE